MHLQLIYVYTLLYLNKVKQVILRQREYVDTFLMYIFTRFFNDKYYGRREYLLSEGIICC
jgi:hypothetical protein